ncbi:MAG: VCBS repeat-containing protein [Candidatus Latescibacterota bacterium]
MDTSWELTILDANPESAHDLGSLAWGDIDGDGQPEIVTGGTGALLWYRPASGEGGLIATGHFAVGLALEDLDGDGRLEVVTGEQTEDRQLISWYDPGTDLRQPWQRHEIDPAADGSAHDVLFADLDGDGRRELVANAAYCATPGLFYYTPGPDLTAPWQKHLVDQGVFAEGISIGDLDGDGRLDLVHGPYVYLQPASGAASGRWPRTVYAPGFREMCRTAVVDITGSGRLDIVVAESEYMDGRFSWFENRLDRDPQHPWVEREIDRGWVYAHSLQAWRDGGRAHVFIAEMAAGGWNAPRNWDARLLRLTTADGGASWQREVICRGQGTHQACMADVDGDGRLEVLGKQWQVPAVQLWRQPAAPSLPVRFAHRLLDRDKPYTAIDILAADLDGDGRNDVLCGSWWYHHGDWERRAIPGIHQVIAARDLDGDGRPEVIGTRQRAGASSGYDGLTSDLVWLRPIAPLQDRWEEHPIGTGSGDWPHGALMAPLLPGGRLALVVGYHSAASGHYPEIFAVPSDLSQPWPHSRLAEIPYGEELVACDLTGNGLLDIVAGCWWLENRGDGTFAPHLLCPEPRDVARLRVADLDGDGRPEILFVEEKMDYATRRTFLAPVAYFSQAADVRQPWTLHVIDQVRSPHSLDVADLDGDGQLEVIVGEHDPFWPYRTRSRLLVYKAADPKARTWTRFVADDRFEHHDGTKVIDLGGGRLGIMSHGWTDSRYVHLWEVER